MFRPQRFGALVSLGFCLAAGVRAENPVIAALQPFVESKVLSGAVTVVADKDKILSKDAVGFADIATGRKMTPDAVFWIASQTKAMTAAALMILVDEGKVKITDPVEKYLPEFRGEWLVVEDDKEHQLLRHPKHPITIENILSHTSGLKFRSTVEQPTLDMLPLRVAVLSYASEPLTFEPDTKYMYSNEGINTAGRIIEVVAGMPYEKFLHERLLAPLGMTETTFWPNEAQVARLAKSYKPNKEKTDLEEIKISQLTYPLSDPKRQPMPGGGLFSTANDVTRFCQMLANDGTLEGKKVLSPDAVRVMTSRHTAPEIKEGYGFGLTISPNVFGHGGAMGTNMTVDRARNLITVWLVQHQGLDGKVQEAFKKTAAAEFAR